MSEQNNPQGNDPYRTAPGAPDPDDHPTHVTVDGWRHKIAKIDTHADGPAHTHRVHLGCGMTIDVDIGGVKKAARWRERAEQVLNEGHKHLHKEHLARATQEEANGHTWRHSRWGHHGNEKMADCPDCVAHENGAPAIVHDLGHTVAKTVPGDEATDISCPKCGHRVYRRRATKSETALEYACSGSGHEFTLDDLAVHLQSGLASLAALIKAK